MSSRRELSDQTRNAQAQRYKRTLESREDLPKPAPTVRIGDRDPITGRDNVIHPSGSTTTSGVRVFNAAVPTGAYVEGLQGYGNDAIALNAPNATPIPRFVEPEPEKTGLVKVLFSVVRNDLREFYIGGDRPTPAKIASFSATTVFDNSGIPGTGTPTLSNLGRGKNQWFAGFNFFNNELGNNLGLFSSSGLRIISVDSPDGSSIFGRYLGSDFSFVINQDGANTQRYETFSYRGTEIVNQAEITYPEGDNSAGLIALLPSVFLGGVGVPTLVEVKLTRSLYQIISPSMFEIVDSDGNMFPVSGFTGFEARRSNWVNNMIYVTPTKPGQPSRLLDTYAQQDASIDVEVYKVQPSGEGLEIVKQEQSIKTKVFSLKLSNSDSYTIHSASFRK